MVLAPEHPLVDADRAARGLAAAGTDAALDRRRPRRHPAEARSRATAARRARKSDLDRQEDRDKTGVFTGAWPPTR